MAWCCRADGGCWRSSRGYPQHAGTAVLKWGFVPLTTYTGVVGAFLDVLGCRA